MRATIPAALAVLAVIGGYAVSPYWTLLGIGDAIEKRDAVALHDAADWVAIRAALKTDISVKLSETMRDGPPPRSEFEKAGNLIGFALAGPLIDRLLETHLSPQGVIAARHGDGGARAALRDWVSYAFFDGPLTFRIELINPITKEKLGAALMRFSGTWRITQAALAPDFLADIRRNASSTKR